jgi:hypothetical protein
MRIAVISDIHVLGPGEHELHRELEAAIGHGDGLMRRQWQRFLHAMRRRFWNWRPDSRRACFVEALLEMQAYHPDWVVANGDYGGDSVGVGLSDEATYESAAGVIILMRELWPERCHFIFGDHDIGKYSTVLKQGGIRLASLDLGEQKLGIRSFWHEQVDDFHLVGVNSSLITLDYFLPEALTEEIPEWQRRRREHEQQVYNAFAAMPADARVILFCHDPSALGVLVQNPLIRQKQAQIELTVLGHLHEPRFLQLLQRLPKLPRWKPRYPVARIVSEGIRSAKQWQPFNPVVCPSPFGTGHHLSGGLLFIEQDERGQLVTRRQRIRL